MAQNKTNHKASMSSSDIRLKLLKPKNSLMNLNTFETTHTHKTATSSVEPKEWNKTIGSG